MVSYTIDSSSSTLPGWGRPSDPQRTFVPIESCRRLGLELDIDLAQSQAACLKPMRSMPRCVRLVGSPAPRGC
jgi:hypothetical protein